MTRCILETVAHQRNLVLLVVISIFAVIGQVAVGQPASFQEAPSLAERVSRGELPPVEERLPENPLVIEPYERIGQYGGTLNLHLLGGSDHSTIQTTLAYEHLVRWDLQWGQPIPNVAERFEVNEDATEFTFYLRRGMKWSDGHPFTADDIMFWYEDIALNPELSPGGPPSWMHITVDGERVSGTVEKVDDYTVRFLFPVSHGLLLYFMAEPDGYHPVNYPRHYAEQFHATYNPEGIDALIRSAGVSNWVELFNLRVGNLISAGPFANPERPVLFAWAVTTPYDGRSTRVVAERNPYYWKVDTEGNQLPYIDRQVYDIIESTEILLLKVMNGEIDYASHWRLPLADKAVLFDNIERGNYRFLDLVSDFSAAVGLFLNLTHQDPVMREIFSNKDFRIGVSHAIDRQEIIDVVFIGQGEPFQVSSRPESPFYNERYAKQYTEYDVDLANEYLDRTGYVERDAQGYRLGPDGERISFLIEARASRQNLIDSSELIANQLREVGLDVQVRAVEDSFIYTRRDSNLHDAIVTTGAGGLGEITNAKMHVPVDTGAEHAVLWAYWYMDDPRAEEPPAEVRRQLDLYRQLVTTSDLSRQAELMEEIIQIAADQFYHIGINLAVGSYGIAKNNLRNVPEVMPASHRWFVPAPSNVSTWFFE